MREEERREAAFTLNLHLDAAGRQRRTAPGRGGGRRRRTVRDARAATLLRRPRGRQTLASALDRGSPMNAQDLSKADDSRAWRRIRSTRRGADGAARDRAAKAKPARPPSRRATPGAERTTTTFHLFARTRESTSTARRARLAGAYGVRHSRPGKARRQRQDARASEQAHIARACSTARRAMDATTGLYSWAALERRGDFLRRPVTHCDRSGGGECSAHAVGNVLFALGMRRARRRVLLPGPPLLYPMRVASSVAAGRGRPRVDTSAPSARPDLAVHRAQQKEARGRFAWRKKRAVVTRRRRRRARNASRGARRSRRRREHAPDWKLTAVPKRAALGRRDAARLRDRERGELLGAPAVDADARAKSPRVAPLRMATEKPCVISPAFGPR